MNLQNTTVVITGASRGLGKELARALVAAGSKVVISCKPGAELEAAAAELGCVAIPADVTDEAQMKALADQATAKFGRIDLWVNNAGLWAPHAPVGQQDMHRAHEMVEVNLFGTVYGSRAALAAMQQTGGTIVNILSTSALEGRANSSMYCASKYAAVGFTSSLRREVEGSSVQVIAVYPGGMKTELFREAPPADYASYMEPAEVASRIVANLQQGNPEQELVVRQV